MRKIEIVDVGPRDGLQNEPVIFSTETKLEMIRRLLDCGLRRIEVASFVNPKKVPQMADAEAVIAGLPKVEGATFIGLVLNERGYERAAETAIDEFGFVACATDSFGLKNQGQTARESVDLATKMLRRAWKDGRRAQVTISLAFGCPFEGAVPFVRVIDMAKRLADAEPVEIALADTIGVGVPAKVTELFSRVRDAVLGTRLRAHFHDTRNTGIANAWAAVEAGAATVDASIAGLGGCPFAPAATGNVATEDLLYLLERSGIRTDVSLPGLIATAFWVEERLGRKIASRVAHAGGFPQAAAPAAGKVA